MNKTLNAKEKILSKLNSTTNTTIQWEDEQTVLTMILGDKNNRANYIVSALEVDMFTNPSCKKIFNDLKDISRVEFVPSLQNFLAVQDDEELREEAKKLASNYITNVNCKFYIERIRNSYFERAIVSATSCQEARRILDLRQQFTDIDAFANDKDIENEITDTISGNKELLNFGMPTVDRTIGSLQGGDVMILAGGTGGGKTCMALNFVNRVRENKKVLLFSLEMTAPQLVSRLCCMNLDIDSFNLRNNLLNDKQKEEIKSYIHSGRATRNLKIASRKDLKASEIKSIAQATECDLIVIDYLGLIKPEFYGSRYEVVSENSRRIKLMALELNKPVILLHQISRAYMQRQDKRPQLSDLRDSGNIEQDADIVSFVHRPYLTQESLVDDHIELLTRKNRFGTPNKGNILIFNGATQLITDKEELGIYD